jgi:putative hydrolase of the HAD superfamily
MNSPGQITTLFLDIGGVLLTDGWGLDYRSAAAEAFKLDPKELEARHHQAFDTYEMGKLSLNEYLDQVVFHQKQSFTHAQFQAFMFAQSKPYPQMLALVRGLKAQYGLKVLVVSNEGRELNAHRIREFKLGEFVDAFISSCFVQLRKPDPAIFRLALDIAQIPPQHVLYLENTPMFIRVAQDLGIRSLLHTDYTSTCRDLASLGLKPTDPPPEPTGMP